MPMSNVRPGSPEDKAFFANLETRGVAQVRQMYSAGAWATALMPAVSQWLSERDQEERLRGEASQNERTKIARSGNKGTWIAAVAAIVAALFSILGTVITYLSWIGPHR
jgi:hypothetical protein